MNMNRKKLEQLISALMRMRGYKEPYIYIVQGDSSRYKYTPYPRYLRTASGVYIDYFSKTGQICIDIDTNGDLLTIENKDIINEIGKFI